MKRKKPIIAGLLSAFFPGIGHFYLDMPLLGLMYVLILGIIPLIILINWGIDYFSGALIAILIGIIIHLYIIIDSVKKAKKVTSENIKYPVLSKWYILVIVIIIFVLLQQLCVLYVQSNFVKATQIYAGSMENTLMVGDYLMLDRRYYKKINIKVGDIAVFKYPKDESINYVKRCIAVAGQTIEIKNKMVFLDGKPLLNPGGIKFSDSVYTKEYVESDIFPTGNGNRDNYRSVTVPPEHVFMMGDNRDNSYDSRYWGFLPMKNIIGKPTYIYFNRKRLDRIGKVVY